MKTASVITEPITLKNWEEAAIASWRPEVIEGLLGLVAKSLEKLEKSGERYRLAHRHAEYYRRLFERAEVEWETRPAVEWLDDYGWCIDNLRMALHWAFSPGGYASLGVALTATAVPLWMQLMRAAAVWVRTQRT